MFWPRCWKAAPNGYWAFFLMAGMKILDATSCVVIGSGVVDGVPTGTLDGSKGVQAKVRILSEMLASRNVPVSNAAASCTRIVQVPGANWLA